MAETNNVVTLRTRQVETLERLRGLLFELEQETLLPELHEQICAARLDVDHAIEDLR
jgi:hypothetical protein